MGKEKEIVIKLHSNGKREVEANNFTGGGCLKATADLLKAMGGRQQGVTKKKEINAPTKDRDKEVGW